MPRLGDECFLFIRYDGNGDAKGGTAACVILGFADGNVTLVCFGVTDNREGWVTTLPWAVVRAAWVAHETVVPKGLLAAVLVDGIARCVLGVDEAARTVLVNTGKRVLKWVPVHKVKSGSELREAARPAWQSVLRGDKSVTEMYGLPLTMA